jgi:hypothetical protein
MASDMPNLPLELVDAIIAKLPICYMMQTVILSKRFMETTPKCFDCIARDQFRIACMDYLDRDEEPEYVDPMVMYTLQDYPAKDRLFEELSRVVDLVQTEEAIDRLSRFLGKMGIVEFIQVAWEKLLERDFRSERLNLSIVSVEAAKAGDVDTLRFVDNIQLPKESYEVDDDDEVDEVDDDDDDDDYEDEDAKEIRERHEKVLEAAYRSKQAEVIKYAAANYPIDDCPFWVLECCPYLMNLSPERLQLHYEDTGEEYGYDDVYSEDEFGFDVDDYTSDYE